MSKAGKILSVSPLYVLPGGEVIIECEDFEFAYESGYGCFFDGVKAQIVSASSDRVIAIAPEILDGVESEIILESGDDASDPYPVVIGAKIVDGLHLVANPAVDPADDSIILTHSGSRGQSLPVTLFRFNNDGDLLEIPAEVFNPTGVAFDSNGRLFVTNRKDGEVFQIIDDGTAVSYSSELGVATGIAFDDAGSMFIGDRRGTIFKISDFGIPEIFASIEPSVAAFHLAFNKEGVLCVSAPSLASFDRIYSIQKDGTVDTYFHGLGRPQGLAFDKSGNLYVAACLHGQRGIVKITETGEANLLVAGHNIVGLCFNKKGDLIVATNDSVFKFETAIMGILV